MTLGEKLSSLRKKHSYTQEQFAELLGVSRQSVSKWESDTSYPETDKLIRISQLFQCSLDYLLKDDIETPEDANFTRYSSTDSIHYSDASSSLSDLNDASDSSFITYKYRVKLPTPIDKKSKHTIAGLPLWHITSSPKQTSKGIFALGFKARGIFSLGFLSLGVFSFGFLSIGIFSLALFALGVLSIGCFALGLIAIGSISIGVISIGALSVGEFSIGALAIGKYFAIGDSAYGAIAIGKTTANGSLFNSLHKLSELSSADITHIKNLLDDTVPNYLEWANRLVQLLLSI